MQDQIIPFLGRPTDALVAIDHIGIRTSLTVANINSLSDKIAQQLRLVISHAPTSFAPKIVAVVMEKGWEQIVTVFGILKLHGGAYLPIDSHTWPEHRIKQVPVMD